MLILIISHMTPDVRLNRSQLSDVTSNYIDLALN